MRETLGKIFCILGAVMVLLAFATYHTDPTQSLLFLLSGGACSLVSLIMLSDAAVEEEDSYE